MVNKYIPVINEMGDTSVNARVAWMLVCICMLVFILCLTDVLKSTSVTSVHGNKYKIDSDLRWMGQFEARFFYPSYHKQKNITNLPTWCNVWSLVKTFSATFSGIPIVNIYTYIHNGVNEEYNCFEDVPLIQHQLINYCDVYMSGHINRSHS